MLFSVEDSPLFRRNPSPTEKEPDEIKSVLLRAAVALYIEEKFPPDIKAVCGRYFTLLGRQLVPLLNRLYGNESWLETVMAEIEQVGKEASLLLAVQPNADHEGGE